VKQQARLLGLDEGAQIVIVDGPPGIGCPVISAASGADLALIVVEPTVAGIHDMARMLETVEHFRIPALVCINKSDIYPPGASEIEAFCGQRQLEIAGRIPYEEAVIEAMVQGQPVTACFPENLASQALVQLWEYVAAYLDRQETQS
jgi:MinD superfamily P-loop ATPase